ncbi:MAG: hypothetical protein ABJC19_10235 [Gemmatimonadota bacterium]
MRLPFGHKPQRGDVGDRTARYTAIAWCSVAGMLGASAAVAVLRVPVIPALAGAALFAYCAGSIIAGLAGHSSHTFVHTLLAGRGEPRAHEYSAQEALLIQGKVEDSIKSFHSYIAHHPEDLDARIRLAEVLAKEGNDRAAAEEMFLEARILGTSKRQEVSVGNGLIDLHQRSGHGEKLRAELARFARLHEGTVEGRNARERLRQMLQGDA